LIISPKTNLHHDNIFTNFRRINNFRNVILDIPYDNNYNFTGEKKMKITIQILYQNRPIYVRYLLTEAQKEIRYHNGGYGSPMWPEEIDILRVEYKDRDITRLVDNESIKEKLYELYGY
jgi:hypothetical protein